MIDPLDINAFEGNEGGDGTEISLTELLEQTIIKALQAMAGPVIGKVDSYDSASARAAITPLVPLLVDGEVIPSPKLPSVPVLWPRSTTHSYTFPIAAGSYMELIPLGHDHSRWLTAGTANQTPTDDRRFSLADLVALPLAPSPQSAPPDPLSYDPAWGVLFGQHKVGDNTASDFAALASLVQTELLNIRNWFDAHIHTTPAGNSGVPTLPFSVSPPAPVLGSVACTTLQAK